MNTLITCDEVARLAFSPDELINTNIVTEADILEAEERYLRPTMGEELIAAIYAGNYLDLRNDYVAPALAQWARYVAQPLAEQRSAVCTNTSHYATYAKNEHLKLLLRTLRRKASTLSRRLGNYLDSHSDEYPEYNPDNNHLNHCSINGDIIQIL